MLQKAFFILIQMTTMFKELQNIYLFNWFNFHLQLLFKAFNDPIIIFVRLKQEGIQQLPNFFKWYKAPDNAVA